MESSASGERGRTQLGATPAQSPRQGRSSAPHKPRGSTFSGVKSREFRAAAIAPRDHDRRGSILSRPSRTFFSSHSVCSRLLSLAIRPEPPDSASRIASSSSLVRCIACW